MKEKKSAQPIEVVPTDQIHDELFKDPKTGKTISKKAAFFVAAGSFLAGNGMKLAGSMQNPGPIEVDANNDLVADTILTDENNDGIYETSQAIEAPELPDEQAAGQSFDVSTAPHASDVNHEMNFSQAFASAREELGPGGVFSWHGQDYSTFYAEEVDDHGNPTIEYDTVDENYLANDTENNDQVQQGGDNTMTGENQQSESAGDDVHVIALDNDSDGIAESYVADLNQDGSADAVYVDANLDGQITEDEVQLIHDPVTLEMAENPTDGSMISVDTNADGMDDVLIADVNSDHVADAIGVDQNQDQVIDENEIQVLNQEAFDNAGFEDNTTDQPGDMGSGQIDYEGEVASDVPDDVPDTELDNFSGDLTNLDDNFTDYNEWV